MPPSPASAKISIDGRERTIYTGFDLHPGQMEVFSSPARFRVLCCGRRWGKTMLSQVELAVAAGQGLPCAYVAPKYKMMEKVWQSMKTMLGPMIYNKSEEMRSIQLFPQTASNSTIDFWSLQDPDALRGQSYALVVIDEAALLPHIRIWQDVIRPTLADRRGRALFTSTPRGLNWFFTLYGYGVDPERKNWAAWKMPTATNPHIDPEEIEEARTSLSAKSFEQEWLAEFRTDAGALFRNVRVCAKAGREDKPQPGHSYVFGVDPAKMHDFFVTVVYDTTANKVVWIERSSHVEYTVQMNRLAVLNEIYRPSKVMLEVNQNPSLVEMAYSRNIPVAEFVTSGTSKPKLIDWLVGAFDRKTLQILEDDDVMIHELETYGMTRSPAGNLKFGAPPGSHDDCVIALALAYWCATYGASDWEMTLV